MFNRKHVHRWEYVNCILIDGKLRAVYICKGCNVAVHRPVLSMKKLEELER